LPYEERPTASGPEKVFLIDAEYVKRMVASVVKDQDLSRYIL
jgi:ATP-dependent HslUV protease ATP-binding subunit HslU